MTTTQLAAAQRRTLVRVAVGAAVLLVLAGVILVRRARKGTVEGGPKRVVVLPFENLGAAEDEYFADGVADTVRGSLRP
jgi:hypothetical protein